MTDQEREMDLLIGELQQENGRLREALAGVKPCLTPERTTKTKWKLMPEQATKEMLKAMDECSTEGYDERLYAGHASSVYSAAWDAFQAEQVEPVVWMYQDKSTHEVRFQKHMAGFVDHGQTYETPLYTQPQEPVIDKSAAIRIATALGWTPPRQPLTDEEIRKLLSWAYNDTTDRQPLIVFARAIEAAHGIGKENT